MTGGRRTALGLGFWPDRPRHRGGHAAVGVDVVGISAFAEQLERARHPVRALVHRW